jgi:enediyne biosynthesis protein E7
MAQGKDIPQLEGHPVLGNLPEFKRGPHEFMARALSLDSGLVQFRIFNKKMIAVLSAQCAETIFKSKSHNFPRGKQRKPLESLLGKGLVNLEGDKWKDHRRMVAQGFRPEFLRDSLDHNSNLVSTLLDGWERKSKSSEAIDIVEEMRQITLSVIIKALFSVDLNLDDNQRLYHAITNANKVLFKRYVSLINFPDWMPTPLNRQMAETRRAMDAYTEEQFQLRQSNSEVKTGDIFDHFLALQQAGEMTREDIFSEIKTLLVAGFETSAAALAWTLYLIAKNPQVTDRWYGELDEHLGGEPPNWDNISKLKFTEQLFMEGLRLFPPVYMLSRTTLEDIQVEEFQIPAGSPVVLSIYAIHRSEEYWENPNDFRPERFEGDWPEHAYFPFGLGKHVCIGNRFSMLESTLILASIGQRFGLSLTENQEITGEAGVTLTPKEKILVKLDKRN